jgi:hypothetical protein
MRYALALLLSAALAAVFMAPAVAQETTCPEPEPDQVVVCWEPPTTRVDGQPLAPDEISHYEVGCVAEGLTPADGYAADYTIPGTDQQHQTEPAAIVDDYGRYACALRTVDTDGLKSTWSSTFPVIWPAARPGPPVNVLIITGGTQ